MGCKLIKKLFDHYKNSNILEKKIFEKILEMKESKSYLVRSTILLFIKVIRLNYSYVFLLGNM